MPALHDGDGTWDLNATGGPGSSFGERDDVPGTRVVDEEPRGESSDDRAAELSEKASGAASGSTRLATGYFSGARTKRAAKLPFASWSPFFSSSVPQIQSSVSTFTSTVPAPPTSPNGIPDGGASRV